MFWNRNRPQEFKANTVNKFEHNAQSWTPTNRNKIKIQAKDMKILRATEGGRKRIRN
jgi:hypothetical protein